MEVPGAAAPPSALKHLAVNWFVIDAGRTSWPVWAANDDHTSAIFADTGHWAEGESGRTLAVQKRELDDTGRADTGDGRLDVRDARVLELLLLGRVLVVGDEFLWDERLAERGAPVGRRLGKDRTELRCGALVYLRVVVRERDGAGVGIVRGVRKEGARGRDIHLLVVRDVHTWPDLLVGTARARGFGSRTEEVEDTTSFDGFLELALGLPEGSGVLFNVSAVNIIQQARHKTYGVGAMPADELLVIASKEVGDVVEGAGEHARLLGRLCGRLDGALQTAMSIANSCADSPRIRTALGLAVPLAVVVFEALVLLGFAGFVVVAFAVFVGLGALVVFTLVVFALVVFAAFVAVGFGALVVFTLVVFGFVTLGALGLGALVVVFLLARRSRSEDSSSSSSSTSRASRSSSSSSSSSTSRASRSSSSSSSSKSRASRSSLASSSSKSSTGAGTMEGSVAPFTYIQEVSTRRCRTMTTTYIGKVSGSSIANRGGLDGSGERENGKDEKAVERRHD